MDSKEPNQRKAKAEGGKPEAKADAKRTPKKIPPDTTVAKLAKAMWTEIKLKPGEGKEKVSKEQRVESWKSDQNEYKKMARRVIARLSRRAGGKGKLRGGKAAAGGTAK